ncbi:MAG: 50S ribosomal protein L25 [Candidatus Marinimicrobia bacterium]|nr:50S ribosomal protein L25 [Candidatus Neomarinimicrobiota bacterium]
MKKNEVKAILRKDISKRANKQIRRDGMIPAVYYSKGEDNINLQVNNRDFLTILKTGIHIFELNIGKDKKNALIKEIQFHPVTEQIIHIDFHGVSLTEEVDVNVKLNFIGTAIGIKEGGVPEMLMHDIEIRCKAGEIPKSLDVDISELDVGDILFVKDLDFGDLTILSSPDAIIVTVTVPHIELEAQIPDEDEYEEVADVEEGEDTEGEKLDESQEADTDEKKEESEKGKE